MVILGAGPVPRPGPGRGLAFSVAPGVRLPPSLQNIFREMQRDLGWLSPFPEPGRQPGQLGRQNGVLLLNTCLDGRRGPGRQPAGKGWES